MQVIHIVVEKPILLNYLNAHCTCIQIMFKAYALLHNYYENECNDIERKL